MRFLTTLAACTMVLAGVQAAQADVLVTYTFDGAGAADRTPAPGLNINASNVSLVGLNEDTSRSNVLGLTSAGSTFTDYLAFTLTAVPTGQVIDLSAGSVSFVIDDINGSGKAIQVEAIADGTTVTLPQTSGEVDGPYTSPAFVGLPAASSVDVRIYYRADATWNDLSLDNITVDGLLVPEPASLALLGIGGLVCIRRRR